MSASGFAEVLELGTALMTRWDEREQVRPERYPSDSGALSAATEAEYPVGDEVGLLVDDEVAGLGHQLEVERV